MGPRAAPTDLPFVTQRGLFMLKYVLMLGLLAGSVGAAGAGAATLTVVTHDSFSVDKKLIAQFEARSGAKVRLVKAGDAGEMLNRLILTRRAPIGDVVYGFDNTLLPRARAAGILEAYRSPALSQVPAKYQQDAGLNTVDYGWVALNYDKAWFTKSGLALPKTLDDLARPEYAKLTVVESPATSSTGAAFLLATVEHFGPDAAWNWWRTARQNGMLVTRGWEDAYNTQFSKNGGKYPIVLSYASSPAAEVAYSDKPLTESPTANLLLPGSTFLQLEGVGVLKGTGQAALARQFVDFMLSASVQADFPTRMWVYPARQGVKLDPLFRFAQVPPQAQPAPAALLAQAPALTDAWVTQVLRR